MAELMPLGLFLFHYYYSLLYFFGGSLAPDLQFALGETNTRRFFRYTGQGSYLE